MKLELNKTHNMNCLNGLKLLDNNTIDLLVTSPPYYNAREYTQWDNIEIYMRDMTEIFSEVYRVLKNHRYIVVNIGDIVGQIGKAKWSIKKKFH